MTKSLFQIALGLAVSVSLSRADDITLNDGTVLKNAKIVKSDDSKKIVTISFSGGTAQVQSEMVPTRPATSDTASQTTQTPQFPTPEQPNTPIPKDWTVNGRDYHNVGVTQVEADRVHITYEGGLGTLMLADLPPDLKRRFAYDSDAANKEQAKRDAYAQSAQQEYASLDAARAKAQAKETASEATATRLANLPKAYLLGEVLQKVPGVGLLVDCQMPEPVASSSASIGGGGGVYIPQTGCPKGVNQAYGTFMLTGYPNESAIVDGAGIHTVALQNGTYSYTSVQGANRTVQSYVATAP